MTATLVLPSVLAGRARGARTLPVSGGTLAEVLDGVGVDHAELADVIRGRTGLSRFMNVYVNGVDVRTSGGLSTPVALGDEISVIPAVAGG